MAAPPIIACIPRKSDVKNCREFPDLFPACAVTRSMAKPLSENQVEVPLHDTFFYTVNTGELGSDVSKCPEQRDLKSFPSLFLTRKIQQCCKVNLLIHLRFYPLLRKLMLSSLMLMTVL